MNTPTTEDEVMALREKAQALQDQANTLLGTASYQEAADAAWDAFEALHAAIESL